MRETLEGLHAKLRGRVSLTDYILRVAAGLFLIGQLLFLIAFQADTQRKFLFTPYAGQTAFRLNVTAAGTPLNTGQVLARYHLPFKGRVDLTPEGLQAVVRHHETEYARGDEAIVRLHFSRNRGTEEIWLWPQL